MKNISLLDISGPIDENTPNIVLEEIRQVHEIEKEEFSSSDVFSFSFHKPLLQSEYYDAIQLINSDTNWPVSNLQSAFSFVLTFIERPFFSDRIAIGRATPNTTHSYSACMLYRLLKNKNLEIHATCSIDQLKTAVEIAYKRADLSRIVFFSLFQNTQSADLSKAYLASIKSSPLVTPVIPEFEESSSEFVDDADDMDMVEIDCISDHLQEITYNSLCEAQRGLADYRNVIRRVTPSTAAEAIYLSAIIYEIDISKARDPVKEYELISLRGPYEYIPFDKDLKKEVSQNTHILKLNHTFNPLLPQELYLESSLRKMAEFEGYDEDYVREDDLNYESYYSLMQTAYLSETFHRGLCCNNIINTYTLEDDDVYDLPFGLIVSFGNPRNKVTVFRYRELSKYFLKEKCFKNPYDRSLFPEIAIRKLLNICSFVFREDNAEHVEERNQLAKTIDIVCTLEKEGSGKLKKLYDEYFSSGGTIQEQIKNTIISLMELGMYMRGWMGQGEYPIIDCPVDDQDQVDLNVNVAMIKFENDCKHLGKLSPELGLTMQNLPLLFFSKGKYLPSSNPEQGLTIYEKIEIVKANGDDILYSCIRLSSFWICSTAYRVATLLEIDPGFDIYDLKNIG